MAATKRAPSPTDSEHAAEETLPLYEEFQCSETQADTLPPPTATPDEVRDYLTSLLKNKHSVPDDHARRVVARWTLGTGRELRNYTPQMYLDIFGREEGWFLYRDVRMDLYRSRTVTSVQKFGAYIFAAVAFTLGFITVMLIVNDVEWAFFFVGPVGVSCVAAIVYLCLHFFVKDDPEANIERALQRCTTREPTR